MGKNKGFIGIGFILAIVLGIVVIGGGVYYLGSKNSKQEVKVDENTNVGNNSYEVPAGPYGTEADYVAPTPIIDNKKVDTTDLKTYTNSKYSFSLNYPVEYLLNESNNGGFFNEVNIFDLSLRVPSDYQKGTDFNTGTIDISVSPTIAKCYYSNGTDEDMTALKVINNKSFHYNPKQPFSDSAMGGQRGSSSMFSIVLNGQCYRIQKLVGYRDLRGFAEPPYPPHFDEQKANLDLDNIISTFKFI